MTTEGQVIDGLWRLSLKYKGTTINVPVRPSDSALSIFEFISEVFEFEVDLVKLIYKGKRVMPTGSICSFLSDGAKLMLVASTRSQVEQVGNSKSDPLLRGFEDSDASGEKQKKTESDMEWGTEQHREYKFCRFKALQFTNVIPHAYEAEKLLGKLGISIKV